MYNSEFVKRLIFHALKASASDIHLSEGHPPILRVNGELQPVKSKKLEKADMEDIIVQMVDDYQMDRLREEKELDFGFCLDEVANLRINIFYKMGGFAIAMRIIPANIRGLGDLGLPEIVSKMARRLEGLILVTGPTGHGKSTTLAAMIHQMNQESNLNIITIEDPIEYKHSVGTCLIQQRELGHHTLSFARALKSALREDPDVILVGEMRDLETISLALTAAETGHLVLSTLHTRNAPDTINRIIDVFPADQQRQILAQLSSSLIGVVSQRLLPRVSGFGRIPAVEVMLASSGIRNLIREGKIHQIYSAIQAETAAGMQTLDDSLLGLLSSESIGREIALRYCIDVSRFRKKGLSAGKMVANDAMPN
jgi:twitching motility protein PilT